MSSQLFTVVLEDYFQVGAFHSMVDRRHWYRFESRIERSADRALELLDAAKSRATFFVLGSVAEQMPELVRRIAAAGHEVADRGFSRLRAESTGREEFLDDLRRGREAVSRASGRVVHGHRCCDWLTGAATKTLDLLASEGYRYDSSVRALGFASGSRRRASLPATHVWQDRTLDEIPVSAATFGPLLLPSGGGAWLRHLPTRSLHRAKARAAARGVPFVSCVHSWELDPEQPRLAASRLTRIRHYRNLDRMAERAALLLAAAPTDSIQSWLGIPVEPQRANETQQAAVRVRTDAHVAPNAVRQPLSVVIPCYNEASAVGYLDRTLRSVSEQLSPSYDVEFVFVDDGSCDSTWVRLNEHFGARADCTLVRHMRNRGVGAAIRTGVEASRAPIVASIDADCTYDPHEIEQMVRLLTPDVAMVTASPYHPHGAVRNVPGWRLLLSRGLSQLYRPLTPERLYTITSCCRVYRRDVVLSVPTRHDDYRGIAEWLVRITLAGGRVVEHPAVLESRVLGVSKMNVMRAVIGHLGLLAELTRKRLSGRTDPLTTTPPPLVRGPAASRTPRTA